MRFLVDECTGPGVAQWLRQQGHTVYSVFDEARGIDDDRVLQLAFAGNYMLITNDSDFGEKIFREQRPHHGVIFLRLHDERTANKIAVIESLLQQHHERLGNTFTVVTETRIRFASN
jgi:predicted nuclease of predicted toxin-antitoxin system